MNNEKQEAEKNGLPTAAHKKMFSQYKKRGDFESGFVSIKLIPVKLVSKDLKQIRKA